ncbi:hypothetical protein EVG20_g5157 [Dentipellis fragilis]|uniref:Uncharacterized protein n=1 Tax=Dentipellis fragilis TaxID=205917 RepID=A0A4Y9YW14_9AGAM|nr:hypothetical protein EVG20_g5157 [Dentipellis fragilis]
MDDAKSGCGGISIESRLQEHSEDETRVTLTYFRPPQSRSRCPHSRMQRADDKIQGTSSLRHVIPISASSLQNSFAKDTASSYRSLGYRGVVVSELKPSPDGSPRRSRSVVSDSKARGVAGHPSTSRHGATYASDSQGPDIVASHRLLRRQRGILSELNASSDGRSTYAQDAAVTTRPPGDSTGIRSLRSSHGRVRLPVAAKSTPVRTRYLVDATNLSVIGVDLEEISVALTSLTTPVATALPDTTCAGPSTLELRSHGRSSSHVQLSRSPRHRASCPSARRRHPRLWSISSPPAKWTPSPKLTTDGLDKPYSYAKTKDASAKSLPPGFLGRKPKWPAVRVTVGLLPQRVNSDKLGAGSRESVVPEWSLDDFDDPGIRLEGNKQAEPPRSSSRLVPAPHFEIAAMDPTELFPSSHVSERLATSLRFRAPKVIEIVDIWLSNAPQSSSHTTCDVQILAKDPSIGFPRLLRPKQPVRREDTKRTQHGSDDVRLSTANGSSSATDLPEDVLLLIFDIVQQDWLLHWASRSTSSLAVQWMSVSHVCRHWRHTALRSARLWTMVTSVPSPLIPLFIQRSQTAPLHASLQLFDTHHATAVRQIIHIAYRLSCLYLRGSSTSMLEVLQTPSGPAPLLDMLILLASEDCRDFAATSDFVLPSDLFAGYVPRLRVLRLTGLTVTPDSPFFAETLTCLTLCGNVNEVRVPKVSLAAFIGILLRLPNLTDLAATDIISQADPGGAASLAISLIGVPLVELNKLERLGFSTAFPSVWKAFIARISAPNVRCIHLISPVTTPAELSFPFYPVSKAWPNASPSPLGLSIVGQEGDLTINGSRSCLYHDTSPPMDRLDCECFPYAASLRLDASAYGLPQLLSTLCAPLPLHAIEHLQMFYYGPEIDWVALLQPMTNLESLHVAFPRWERLLPVLSTGIIDDSGTLRMLCPKLQKLSFTSDIDESPGLFFEALAIALQVRKANGLELKELFYNRKPIPCRGPTDLVRLRQRTISLRKRIQNRISLTLM